MPHPRRTAAPMQGPAAWGSRTPPAARLRGLCPTAGQRAGQAACSGRGCCGRAPDAPPAPAGAGLCCGQTSHRDTAGLPAAGGAAPPGTAPAPRPCRSAAPAGQSRCRGRPVPAAAPRPPPAWRARWARRCGQSSTAGPAVRHTPPHSWPAAARGQRQADAQVAALHAGQHHRSAQKQVEQRIPRTQPGKTPPPGQAVGGGHHRAACENFITNCHGSRQLRGQQYQCRHCRQRRPGAQPHPSAHGGAQQTGCGEKQGSKDKIGQQKLVEVDHAFQCRSPLAASVPPGGGKACRNRKTACGLYKSNTFIDLVSHFLHFLQKGT